MSAIHFNEEDSNTSANPRFEQVLETRLQRRQMRRGAARLAWRARACSAAPA